MPTQHQHRPSRHLWVGNFPEDVTRDKILNYFGKYGRIEEVHILPQKHPSQGIAAFIDFYDRSDAIEACKERHRMGGRELRLNYKFTDKSSPDEGHSPPRGGRDNQRSRKKRSSPSTDAEDSSGSDSSQSSSSDSDANSGRKKTSSRKKKSKDSSSAGESSDSSDSEDSDHEREKKFGHQLRVLNVNSRPSDQNVEEQLSVEFKKYGSPTVRVQWNKNDRTAMLRFRSTEDCRKAYKNMKDCSLFGQKLKLVPVPDSRSGGHRDGSPSREEGSDLGTTRCLFVGNIPKGVSVYELRDTFLPFGMILDAQIKKMSGNITYGFVHFLDLMSAIMAQKRMNGERMGMSRLKVGFGRGSPSKAIWVDGIDPHSSEASLERTFSKYGEIMKLVVDRRKRCALVVFDNTESAKDAMVGLKGTYIGKSRSPAVTDFASKDAIQAFTQSMEMGGPPGGPFPPPGMPGMPYDPMMMGGPPHMMRGMPGYFPPGPGAGMMGGYPPPYPGPMDPYGQPRRGHHGYGGWEPMNEDMDDYSRELAVFQRRRERVREREGRRMRRHSRDSSDSSSDESRSSNRRRKRRLNSGTGSEGDRKDLREVLNKRKDGKQTQGHSSDQAGQKSSKKTSRTTTDNSGSESESEKKRKKSTERPWSPPMEEAWGESGSEGEGKRMGSSHSSGTVGKGKAPKPVQPPKTPSDKEDSTEEDNEEEAPVEQLKGPRTPSASPQHNILGGPMTPPSSEDEQEQGRNGPKTPSMSPEAEPEEEVQVPPNQSLSRRDRSDRSAEIYRRERSPVRSQYDHKHWRKSPPPRQRTPDRRPRHSQSPGRHRSPVSNRGRSPPSNRGKSPPYRSHHYRSPSPHGRYRDSRMGGARSPERYTGRRSPLRSSRDRRRYGRSRSRSPPPRDAMRSRSPPHYHHRGRSPPPRRSRTPPHKSRTPPRRKSRSPPGWSRNRSPGTKRSRSPAGGRTRSPIRRSKGVASPSHHRRGGEHVAAPPPPPKVPRTPSATPPPPEEDVKLEQPKTPSPEPPKEAPSRTPISFKIRSGVPTIGQSATLSHSPEEELEEPAPSKTSKQQSSQQPSESQALLELLRRYPVMWQGHLTLKNEVAAVQLHYLKGSIDLAKLSLPQPPEGQTTAGLKILKRMRLEANQLEGVEKRMEHENEHCLLLALPCGRDPVDVLTQTKALKTGFITYLLQKQAAGIIDMAVGEMNYVLHIFPPCEFSQQHLTRVAPDLLSSASDSGHLMIVVASS